MPCTLCTYRAGKRILLAKEWALFTIVELCASQEHLKELAAKWRWGIKSVCHWSTARKSQSRSYQLMCSSSQMWSIFWVRKWSGTGQELITPTRLLIPAGRVTAAIWATAILLVIFTGMTAQTTYVQGVTDCGNTSISLSEVTLRSPFIGLNKNWWVFFYCEPLYLYGDVTMTCCSHGDCSA